MIIRASIANIRPRELAHAVQNAALSGTVSRSYGAGDWGVEPGATVEFAAFGLVNYTDGTLLAFEPLVFVERLLRERGEHAAYVTVATLRGTAAYLLWSAGTGKPGEVYLDGAKLERIG